MHREVCDGKIGDESVKWAGNVERMDENRPTRIARGHEEMGRRGRPGDGEERKTRRWGGEEDQEMGRRGRPGDGEERKTALHVA